METQTSGQFDRLKNALADRYVVERVLGAGGMATVYLAHDRKHKRKVAIKVLRPELATAVGPERFLREIEIAAQLTHPHILTVHDSGEADGFLFYVMPFIEGESLRERLVRDRQLPIDVVVRILKEILDALSKAHAAGIVHRDIKPGNIMLADEHALVMDFGVAKAASDVSAHGDLTGVGIALGTPTYMSPEQAAGDPNVDHRGDIYSVGVLAYEMLAGRPPFDAKSTQQLAVAHLTEPPTPVSRLRSDIPPALESAVMTCLRKDPADRWQSAADLIAQLAAIETSGAHVSTVTTASHSVGISGTHWRLFAVLALVILVATISVRLWRSETSAASSQTDPSVVAVLPFRVSGADPRLRYLREGMVDLLWARLTGEGGPRAADPTAVLNVYRRETGADQEELSEERAKQLGRRIGAGQVMSGAVVGTSDHIVISAAIMPVDDTWAPTQASVAGSPDSLVSLVDGLVAQLLAREAGIAEQTTSTLAKHPLSAVRAFLAGRSERRLGNYDQALAHFEAAFEEDSTFGLAALEIMLVAGWVVVPDLWRVRDQVWTLRDQLSERDKLTLEVRGLWPVAPKPLAERVAMAERAVAILPSDPELWEILADLYFHRGRYLGLSDAWDRADAVFRRALALDPNRAGPLQHVIHMLAVRGDTTELPVLAARYFQQDSTSELSLFLQWLVAVVQEDTAKRHSVREVFDSTHLLGIQVSDVGETDGIGMEDIDEALAASRRRAATDGQRQVSDLKSALRAFNSGHPTEAEAYLDAVDSKATRMMAALFWDGDTAAAARVADEVGMLANEPTSSDEMERVGQGRAMCLNAIWHLSHDNEASARRTVDRLIREGAQTDTTVRGSADRVCIALMQALIASQHNDLDALARIDRVDSLARIGTPFWEVIPLNLIIARLYEQHGAYDRALAAVQRRPYWWSMFSGNAYLTTYLRNEARLAALVGDTATAIRAYEHYLELRADPEPALLGERNAVREELARLVVAEEK